MPNSSGLLKYQPISYSEFIQCEKNNVHGYMNIEKKRFTLIIAELLANLKIFLFFNLFSKSELK